MSYINKNDEERKKVGSFFSKIFQPKEEKLNLKKIKKHIKKIQSMEELETYTEELEELGIVEKNYIDKLKKKRKKKLEDSKSFIERLQLDAETNRRVEEVLRNFRLKEREKRIPDKDMNRDERTPGDGSRVVDKNRSKGRSIGGR